MRVKSSGNYRREEIPPPQSTPVQLNFKNHCLFCLEPQDPLTVLEIARDNPKNLKSFQPVLHYLTGTDPTYDKSAGECKWMGIPAMEELPPMCYDCYGAMAELYRLHEQLLSIQCLIQEQTQLARQTVPLRSQSSSRHEFMTRIQSSGLNKEEAGAARKFVDNLHNKIIEEVSDKKKVIFPSRTPPHFSLNRVTPLPSTSFSATGYNLDYIAASSTASPKMAYLRSGSRGQLVRSQCSVLENAEVVMLPPVVETDDIKYENEYEEEEEGEEPCMIIPDMGVTCQDPIAESRTKTKGTPTIKKKGKQSSKPTRSLRPRRQRKSRKGRPSNRDAEDSELDEIPRRRRRRLRNVRKVINGVSQYVAQYCDLCSKHLPSAEVLKHLEDDHNLKGYVVECPNPKCPYLFSCSAKMEKHLRNQNPHKCQMAAKRPAGALNKKCEDCGFETRSRTRLRNHLYRHELNLPEKIFSCPISGCGDKCALKQSIDDHINFHELRPPKTEQECSVCKELLNIEDTTEHLREAHQIYEPVRCKRCPFVFHDWNSLLDHLKEHYTPGGMSCDVCDNGIRIDKLEFVREHYFSAHGIGRELLCERCDKPFYLLSTLSIHKYRCSSNVKEDSKDHHRFDTDTDNIKDEDKQGDEQELQQSEMDIPNMDETPENPSPCGEEDTPSPSHTPVAESKTRSSSRIKNNPKTSFEPSRPLPSLNRVRKLVTVAVNKTRTSRLAQKYKKIAEGVVEVERVPRRRLRNVRKVINGRSIYVAQYCDVCNKYLPSSKVLKHLENDHNLKGYVVECPSPKCPYLFSCRGKMEKHMRSQNPKKCQINAKLPMGSLIKKCETCDFETGSSAKLREHIQKHESNMAEKTVCCPIPGCTERYALKQSVDEHINCHELRPPRTEQQCSVCKELLKVEDINEHLKESHKVEQPVPCKRCRFIFHNWESLLKHLSEHDSAVGLSCDICDTGIRIEKFELLLGHYFSVHEIGQQLICEFCSKPFYTQTMLSAHIKRLHSKEKKDRRKSGSRIQCELCPEPIFFNSRFCQRLHDIRFHEGDPFNCKFCDKTFFTKHGLSRHQIEHTGTAKYAYKCSVEGCGRAFQNRTLLGYHELGKHSETEPFQCDTCGKKFNYRKALKIHVERVHLKTALKPICQTCGKTLASKNSLRTHMLIHSGARPHVCHICSQAFRHREAMLTHVRAHEEKGERFRPNGPRSS